MVWPSADVLWEATPKVGSSSLSELTVSERLGVLAEVMLAARAVRGLEEGVWEREEGGKEEENAESLSDVSEEVLGLCCWN